MSRSRVVRERLGRHRRPEVRAADPDVHDAPDRRATVAGPRAGPHPLGEVTHAVEHRVDLRHDVDAVDDDRIVPRHPQRHVEGRAVLGHVDRARPRNIASIRSDRPRSSARARSSCSVSPVDAVLRQVDRELGGLERHLPRAVGLELEELPDRRVPYLGVVAHERVPPRQLGHRNGHPARFGRVRSGSNRSRRTGR